MKKYKLVISEEQDKSLLDYVQYLDLGNRTQVFLCRFKHAATGLKVEEGQALTPPQGNENRRREETACPTQ